MVRRLEAVVGGGHVSVQLIGGFLQDSGSSFCFYTDLQITGSFKCQCWSMLRHAAARLRPKLSVI